MPDMLKTGIRLLLFTCAAAICLAATNLLARGPIEQAALAAAMAARQQVLSTADAFEPIDTAAIDTALYPDLQEVCRATRDGELVGYSFALLPNGYKAKIPVTVGILADGTISKIAIGSISETANVGTKILEAPFQRQFEGTRATPDAIGSGIDTISGATISSRACKQAAQQAALFYTNHLAPQEDQP